MKEPLHPDLKRKLRLNRLIGVPLMSAVALCIFWSVWYSALRGAELVLICLQGFIGALFVWAAWYIWSSGKWYGRVSWVFYHGDRATMQAEYGFNSRGALIVDLTAEGQNRLVLLSGRPQWQVNVESPETVIAHIDPVEGGPVIVETSHGIIWPLERVPTRHIQRPGYKGKS
jgi:hypothetical protein